MVTTLPASLRLRASRRTAGISLLLLSVSTWPSTWPLPCCTAATIMRRPCSVCFEAPRMSLPSMATAGTGASTAGTHGAAGCGSGSGAAHSCSPQALRASCSVPYARNRWPSSESFQQPRVQLRTIRFVSGICAARD